MSIFKVQVDENHVMKGNDYLVENPVANLLIITGMNEHSSRYEAFAYDLNREGISVSVLDHFGQGENAISVQRQEEWPVDGWKLLQKGLNLKVEELRKQGKPVYLMGHSMGSFATQNYLENFPGTVDKAIIMGTNGKNGKASFSMGKIMANLTATKKNWNKEAKLMEKASLGPYAKAVKNRKTDLDWLSYNEENVKKYIADPYCGHSNTHGFFVGMMYGLNELFKSKNLKRINLDTPVLIVAGAEDPVGANGKGPTSLYNVYKKLGVKDVTLKLYPKMRHEILNEVERDKPVADIIEFLKK
jgi:alpha-beta hydrolase superfamily lysophospholipase